jgi:preprotein translocase subunit YajC
VEGLSSLVFLVLLFAVFYFMLIRPQRKRVQQHQQLVSSIERGDEIFTIGGLRGTVTALRDDEVELEVAPGTRVRFLKSAISRRVAEEGGEGEEPDAVDLRDEPASPEERQA